MSEGDSVVREGPGKTRRLRQPVGGSSRAFPVSDTDRLPGGVPWVLDGGVRRSDWPEAEHGLQKVGFYPADMRSL